MAALDQALRNDDSAYEKFTQFENVLSEQYGYDNSLTTARRQDELAARTRKKLTGLWAILGQSFGAIEKPLEIKFLIAPCYVSDSDVPILQMVPLRPSSALAVVVYQVKKYYSNRDGTDDLAGGSLNNVLEFPSFYAEVDIQRIKNGPVLPLTDENIQQYMKNMQCIYVFGNHRQGYCIDMGHGEYSFIMGVGQVDLEIGQGKAPGTQTARRVTVFKSRNNKLATHTHLQTIESSPPISIPQAQAWFTSTEIAHK
ncbi:hypothetical protein DL96DRAFT_876166 [Flagelloscypha sp. PMI_526]|nr:hypothetical protein DL96DRAFT_876166 [Flagelloscypha sp. PMI_526]